MRRRGRSQPAAERRRAEVIRHLAIPAPFTMSGFRSALEGQCGRAVELAPAATPPGAPSGIWIRTKATDYLYYEERTSPFHQAHIVAHLAAHLLLASDAGIIFDMRLAPDVSPQLIQLMLGDVAPSAVSEQDAEMFAFLALSGTVGMPARAARRSLRMLRPLRDALLDAVPEAKRCLSEGSRPTATHRLYQAVIQIREAALVLRPYRNLRAASADAAAALASGLAGDELAAAIEAAVLAEAIGVRKAGRPARRALADTAVDPVTAPDLGSEVAWLAKVSQAFARCCIDDAAEGP